MFDDKEWRWVFGTAGKIRERGTGEEISHNNRSPSDRRFIAICKIAIIPNSKENSNWKIPYQISIPKAKTHTHTHTHLTNEKKLLYSWLDKGSLQQRESVVLFQYGVLDWASIWNRRSLVFDTTLATTVAIPLSHINLVQVYTKRVPSGVRRKQNTPLLLIYKFGQCNGIIIVNVMSNFI